MQVSKPGAGEASGTLTGNLTGTVKGTSYPASVGAGDAGKNLVVTGANAIGLAYSLTPIQWVCTALPGVTSDRWMLLFENTAPTASIARSRYLIGANCVAYQLRLWFDLAAATANVTFALQKNDVDLGGVWTFTINAGTTTNLVTADLTLAAGDRLSLKATASTTDTTAINARVALLLRPIGA
jgi:hypothetical protein